MIPLICKDCRVDTRDIGENAYMVRRTLWDLAVPRRIRGPMFLCIGCLEKRIDRKLDLHDFDTLGVNFPSFGSKSPRLLERLEGWTNIYGPAANRSMQEIMIKNGRALPGFKIVYDEVKR